MVGLYTPRDDGEIGAPGKITVENSNSEWSNYPGAEQRLWDIGDIVKLIEADEAS
jgi:hypothetical protein